MTTKVAFNFTAGAVAGTWDGEVPQPVAMGILSILAATTALGNARNATAPETAVASEASVLDAVRALVGKFAIASEGDTMKAYYARPISIDGTPQFERDRQLIRSLGFEPSPSDAEKAEILQRYKVEGMQAFKASVEASNALVFRAFPDGSIGSGVAQEIAWAQAAGIPVIEIPRQIERRSLNVDQTRAMLAELGQR